MLRKEQNDLLTLTGPETAGWQFLPALLASGVAR